MPISIDKLREAQRPVGERILQFLKENPKEAFTDLEIFGAINGYDNTVIALMASMLNSSERSQAILEVNDTLEGLQIEGLIESASHMGVKYYAIRQGP